jgi:hypothetical protein
MKAQKAVRSAAFCFLPTESGLSPSEVRVIEAEALAESKEKKRTKKRKPPKKRHKRGKEKEGVTAGQEKSETFCHGSCVSQTPLNCAGIEPEAEGSTSRTWQPPLLI